MYGWPLRVNIDLSNDCLCCDRPGPDTGLSGQPHPVLCLLTSVPKTPLTKLSPGIDIINRCDEIYL